MPKRNLPKRNLEDGLPPITGGKDPASHSSSHIQRTLITGILTLIPLWITWIVFTFILNQLSQIGRPALNLLSDFIGTEVAVIDAPWFEPATSILLTLIFIYLVGLAASRIIGRRLIRLFESTIERLPLVQKIYRSVKTLMSSLQQKPDGVQRVVLIEFPSPEMKTVGFVTRTLTDAHTGETIAAVYVPTTPNPTSGYLELVPIDKVTSTDWTVDEAMTFIVSGGAVSGETVNYRKSVSEATSFEEALKADPKLHATGDDDVTKWS